MADEPQIIKQLEKQKFKPSKVAETIELLKKLDGDRPFVTTADKYGKMVAQIVLARNGAKTDIKANFEDETRKIIEFKSNSYALIYKNNLPIRIAPFVWSLDQETRRTWAVFTFNNFYGHKTSFSITKNIRKPIVLTPLDLRPEMVDGYGKGYLIKVDEGSQFQIPLNINDNTEAQKARQDNKNFISSALTLWMDLSQYTKAKLNMRLILIVLLLAAAAVLVFWFIKSHPGFLGGL